MRIESYSNDNFSVFINSCYFKGESLSLKSDLIEYVKNFIFKIKNRVNINGFYKIKVFFYSNIGLFLDIIKLDKSESFDSLEVRIVICEDNLYYETDNYEIVKSCNELRYNEGFFYCVVDDYFEDILEMVEHGRFIYGKEVVKILNNSIIL